MYSETYLVALLKSLFGYFLLSVQDGRQLFMSCVLMANTVHALASDTASFYHVVV